MCAINPADGKYLTAATIFRGNESLNQRGAGSVSSFDVEDQIRKLKAKNSSYFVEWIPQNIVNSICNSSDTTSSSISSTLVANSTAMKHVFNRVLNQFQIMFRRKSFLFWYTGEVTVLRIY